MPQEYYNHAHSYKRVDVADCAHTHEQKQMGGIVALIEKYTRGRGSIEDEDLRCLVNVRVL